MDENDEIDYSYEDYQNYQEPEQSSSPPPMNMQDFQKALICFALAALALAANETTRIVRRDQIFNHLDRVRTTQPSL